MDVNSAAPVELVWAVLSDFEGWPGWNRSVTRIRLEGLGALKAETEARRARSGDGYGRS